MSSPAVTPNPLAGKTPPPVDHNVPDFLKNDFGQAVTPVNLGVGGPSAPVQVDPDILAGLPTAAPGEHTFSQTIDEHTNDPISSDIDDRRTEHVSLHDLEQQFDSRQQHLPSWLPIVDSKVQDLQSRKISDMTDQEKASTIQDYKQLHDEFLNRAVDGVTKSSDLKKMYDLQEGYRKAFISHLADRPKQSPLSKKRKDTK